MLVPLKHKVGPLELFDLLLENSPELLNLLDDRDEGAHIHIGALETLANHSIKFGDFATLDRTYEFVADLARHQSEIESVLFNALHVSFLEGLNFENKRYGEEAKKRLPFLVRGGCAFSPLPHAPITRRSTPR